jgi:hypothetical protein
VVALIERSSSDAKYLGRKMSGWGVECHLTESQGSEGFRVQGPALAIGDLEAPLFHESCMLHNATFLSLFNRQHVLLSVVDSFAIFVAQSLCHPWLGKVKKVPFLNNSPRPRGIQDLPYVTSHGGAQHQRT